MPVRVGVIGVGYLGIHHARVYHELDEAELVGVADLDASRAGEVAQKYSTRAFNDYRDLLPLVDAVSLVTPTLSHRDIGLECLRAGCDLLVEKPIATDLNEADELIGEAERTDRILQVGHLERFNPVVIEAERLIKSPVFFESERLSPFLGRGTDVDVTLDLMIHDIDIILSLCHGRVSEVRAVGASVLSENLDVSKAWIEMDNGIRALVTAGRLSPTKRRTLRVFQHTGFIHIDYQEMEVRYHWRQPDGRIMHDVIRPEKTEPLKNEIRDFLRCVSTRSEPRVSGKDGREALRVALEISRRIKEEV